MELTEFVESLIVGKFGNAPAGHVRMHPSVHREMPQNIGEVKQLGIVSGVRFYADPGMPEGQVRFIDAEGRITVLLPEEKEVEQKVPAEKPKKARKRGKTRKVRARASKVD